MYIKDDEEERVCNAYHDDVMSPANGNDHNGCHIFHMDSAHYGFVRQSLLIED